MADFIQACRWMAEGKHVKRKGEREIFSKTHFVCIVDQNGEDFKVTNLIWFLATDWEIYPNPNNYLDEDDTQRGRKTA